MVYLGTDNVKVTLREQSALAPETDGTCWARSLVEDAAESMAAFEFEARANSLCQMCAVRRSCPIQPEGRGVIA